MIASLLIAVFIVTGAFHFLWALRIWIPITDEARLAQAVVGVEGITRMPPSWAALCVTGLSVAGAYWLGALVQWYTHPFPKWAFESGAWAMAAILLGRGSVTYVMWDKWPQDLVFRRLNRRYYSPLILFLGLGTLFLIVAG